MSFTLFNAAKKRRKAKEEFQAERQSLIKEYNKYSRVINDKIDYYKKCVKDNYPEYEYSNGYTSAVLWMGNAKPFVPYDTLLSGDNEKLKGVVEELKKGVSKVDKIVNEEIEKLTKAIEETKVSVAAFEEFVQKPSMFFVLENIFDGNKLYCFCYEFQVVNKESRSFFFGYVTSGLATALVYADHSNTTLIARGITSVAVKSSRGFRFIDSAMGIARFHCVAVLGADAERLKDAVEVVLIGHSLIAPGILLGERGRDLLSIPSGRNEHSLVVVASKGCRLICLYQRTLTAALTSATNLHNERDIVSACPHTRRKGLYFAVLFDFDATVIGVIFKRHGRRNYTAAESRRTFLFVTDAATSSGMLGAKACTLHYARRMVCFCTERTRYLFGNVHTISALVVQNHSVATCGHTAVDPKGGGFISRQPCVVAVKTDACRSRATFSIVGSSLPRTEALRRIPRQALGLK